MKPVEEAKICIDMCSNCRVWTRWESHFFYCGEVDLGLFNEPCSKDDWVKCPLVDWGKSVKCQ